MNIADGDGLQQRFVDTVCELGFQQLVDRPTRGESILDIVLCNDPFLVNDIMQLPPFSTSDHNSILFLLNYQVIQINDICSLDRESAESKNEHCTTSSEINCGAFRWEEAEWEKMSSFFATVDWTVYINDCYSSDECWINFYVVLCGAIQKFVPKRHIPNFTNSVIKNKIKLSKKKFYNKLIRKKLSKKAAL